MRDHPRVCGEEYQRGGLDAAQKGSPPRMRGREGQPGRVERGTGITPAYAGKSRPAVIIAGHFRDHPRVCGEERKRKKLTGWQRGSPPRVRGKARYVQHGRCQQGITPACAGKRLKRSHSIGHFSCILCLFHSVLHRASVSGGSRAGPCAPPCLPAQNAVPV